MGGILASDAFLSSQTKVKGIIAFDTPFYGLHHKVYTTVSRDKVVSIISPFMENIPVESLTGIYIICFIFVVFLKGMLQMRYQQVLHFYIMLLMLVLIMELLQVIQLLLTVLLQVVQLLLTVLLRGIR